MSDKILKEAFDKLTAIEEAISPEERINVLAARMRRMTEDAEEGEEPLDDLHDRAIDLLDDMLYALSAEEQYAKKGDILRYVIGRLQEVGRAK